ncbi:transporter [Brevundimonas goettingensis]|uniref:Transporter n=1 Tax=Brevundimonas goettingensis TaxID=2774190 RepID=A0A975C250_9CAUL|nr:transporter [Brevundimonas goettingensis]QTC92473.1 transporter [Brevundimonas goettingensis]
MGHRPLKDLRYRRPWGDDSDDQQTGCRPVRARVHAGRGAGHGGTLRLRPARLLRRPAGQGHADLYPRPGSLAGRTGPLRRRLAEDRRLQGREPRLWRHLHPLRRRRTERDPVGVTPYSREKVTDRATVDSEIADGIGDISIGVRHSLARPDGSGLSAAIVGFITAPTGSRDVGDDGFEGGIVLPVSVALNDDWSLSLSPEIDVAADSDGDGRHAAYTIVAGIGRGFGEWALGAEIWVSRDDDPVEASTQSTFDLTAVWTPPMLADSQLDVGLNFGLNDDSPDVEFGVGLARRF